MAAGEVDAGALVATGVFLLKVLLATVFFAGAGLAGAAFAINAALLAGAAPLVPTAFFADTTGLAATFAGRDFLAAATFATETAFFAGAAFLAGADFFEGEAFFAGVAFFAGAAALADAAFFTEAAFDAGEACFMTGFAAETAFFAVAMTISLIKLQKTPNRSSGGAIHRREGPAFWGFGAFTPMNGDTALLGHFSGWILVRNAVNLDLPLEQTHWRLRASGLENQSQLSAPPDWYSMTRVSKKLRSFLRSIISLIQGNGFSSFGKSGSRPIWVARRLAMKRK